MQFGCIDSPLPERVPSAADLAGLDPERSAVVLFNPVVAAAPERLRTVMAR